MIKDSRYCACIYMCTLVPNSKQILPVVSKYITLPRDVNNVNDGQLRIERNDVNARHTFEFIKEVEGRYYVAVASVVKTNTSTAVLRSLPL
jgi:hypothetical protein